MARLLGVLILLLGMLGQQAVCGELQPPRRAVAFTFDDLPFVAGGRPMPEQRQLSATLLHRLVESGVPAVGFVNEGKLHASDGPDPEGVGILEDWLAAGMELGNHSYSHASLNRMPLADFEQDVVRGEVVTKRLMAAQGKSLRYFRHPFLHVGANAGVRADFEKFLAGRGYVVAPVTINSAEWTFAAAYDRAARQGDKEAMRQVAEAYVPYMEQAFANVEQRSIDLFGYEIKQVLLLHANALNAECMGELAAMLRRRGYAFVTLDEALQDRAFATHNAYAGSEGISWLEQWERSFGLYTKPAADVPVFVRRFAGREGYFGY